MALSTPTSLGTATSTSNSATLVSPALAPSANALLIVCAAGRNPATISSIADDFDDTITWETFATNNTTDPDCSVAIFVGRGLGASPGTTKVVTVTWSTATRRRALSVLETTGHDTTTPVSEDAAATSEASTLTVNLGGIAAGNISIGAVGSADDGDGITEGSGETEIDDIVAGDASNGIALQNQHGTTTGVNWSAMNTESNAGVAVEIAVAAAAGGVAVLRRRYEGY